MAIYSTYPIDFFIMVPKISAQIFSQSLLTGTFALISIGNAIASEIPTVKDSEIDRASNPQLGLIADPTGETALDPSPAWKMGYVSSLSDALPIAVDRQVLAQTPKSTFNPNPSEPKKWAVGVHAQASTTGFIGVDGGYKFSPNLHARLGINTTGFNYNYSSQGIDYTANFKPTNIHLLGDYFPFGGGLRLTGGFVAQNNRFTSTAKSGANNQITLAGNSYSIGDVGTVESEGKFGSGIAPYLGVGFGTPISSGFGFNIDAGVMFAGSPTVKLSANNLSSTIPTSLQNEIRSNLATQEQQTNTSFRSFNIYPVLSVGFSYAF